MQILQVSGPAVQSGFAQARDLQGSGARVRRQQAGRLLAVKGAPVLIFRGAAPPPDMSLPLPFSALHVGIVMPRQRHIAFMDRHTSAHFKSGSSTCAEPRPCVLGPDFCSRKIMPQCLLAKITNAPPSYRLYRAKLPARCGKHPRRRFTIGQPWTDVCELQQPQNSTAASQSTHSCNTAWISSDLQPRCPHLTTTTS